MPHLPSPEPIVANSGIMSTTRPQAATFPPSPPPAPFGPNAETPMIIPLGPFRQLFPPTPANTILGTSAGGAAVQIPVNTTTMRSAGVPPDPNAAAQAPAPNGVVLATYNTGISYSTHGGQTLPDGGQAFRDVNGPDRVHR